VPAGGRGTCSLPIQRNVRGRKEETEKASDHAIPLCLLFLREEASLFMYKMKYHLSTIASAEEASQKL